MAAEAEGRAHRGPQVRGRPPARGDDVEAQIGDDRVDAPRQGRARDPALDEGHDGQGRLEPPGAPQEVAGEGLGGADRGARDGPRQDASLDQIAQGGGGGVGVDVPDLLGLDAAPLQRQAQRALLLGAARLGAGRVEGVGRHAGPGENGQDPGPAPGRVRGRLQDQDAGALPEDEAVAVRGEGTRGRDVGAGGQGPHRREGGHRHRVQGRVSAACHDDVGPPQRDEIRPVGDGLRPRGAGRHRGVDAAAGAQLDAHRRGRRIGHEGGHRRRQDPARPPAAQRLPGVDDGADQPHPR